MEVMVKDILPVGNLFVYCRLFDRTCTERNVNPFNCKLPFLILFSYLFC